MSNAIQYHPFAFDVQNRRLTFEGEGRAWDAERNPGYSSESQLLERKLNDSFFKMSPTAGDFTSLSAIALERNMVTRQG